MSMSKGGGQAGERKLITVLFADLRGSLALISGRDPEQADDILSEVTDMMRQAVTRHGGTVARLMGDGVMALFGAPRSVEHHAARACMAALDMRRAAVDGQFPLARRLNIPIDLRIGLNSGEAVVKRVESSVFTGYEANGEVVHVAARLEQIAQRDVILLTADTARLVAAHFDLRSVPPLEIRGLDAPIAVFELLAERSGRFVQSHRSDRAPFVCRQQEATAIDAAWQAVKAGSGRAVLVMGEAGLGKSRLVAETIPRNDPHTLIARAQAHPFRRRGYQVAAELTAACLGFDLPDLRTIDPAALRDRLAAINAPSLFAPIAVVLGHTVDDIHWAALTPSERRDQMQDAVREVIERAAALQTMVLVIEDLHWIDPESLAVLDRIVARLPDLPVLLVATSRPDSEVRWAPNDPVTVLQLTPLPERALRAILAARVEGEHAPRLTELLAKRAGGNPLFAEVMLSGLADEGVLLDLGGLFHVMRDARPEQLPETIRGLISERVDRLTESEKQLLRAAAVIGQRMPLALLGSVVDQPPDALRADAMLLEAAGYVTLNTGADPELEFRHDLLRETVYADLLVRTRRAIHGRVLDAMLASARDPRALPVEDLAEHARQAERWPEAVEYAWQAAQRVLLHDANVEGVYFLRAALTCAAELPADAARTELILRLRLRLRDPLFRLGRIDELAANLRDAAELIDSTTDWHLRGLFHVQWSHTHSLWGDSDASLAECAKALTLARDHDDPALAARAQFQEGLERFQRWEMPAAIIAFETALDYLSAHPADTSYGLQRGFDAAALSYAARAKAELGLFAAAEVDVTALLTLAQQRERAFDCFFAYMAAGHLDEARGAPIAAGAALRQAEAWCQTGHMPLLGAVAASHLGLMMIRAGNVAEGINRLQATHTVIETMGFNGQAAYCLAALAEGHLAQGDLAAARAAAQQATEAAARRHDVGPQIQALVVLAECARQAPERHGKDHAALLAEAIATAERLGLAPLAAHCRVRLTPAL